MSWVRSRSTGTARLCPLPSPSPAGQRTSEEVESEFSIPKLFLHGGLLLMLSESLLQTVRRNKGGRSQGWSLTLPQQ